MADPDDGGAVTLAHVEAAGPEIAAHLGNMYEFRWAAATPGERVFLAAIAQLELGERDRRVRRADIASRLGRSTSSLGPVRDSALSKGVVGEVGHGHLRFTLPGFGPWIRSTDQPDS